LLNHIAQNRFIDLLFLTRRQLASWSSFKCVNNLLIRTLLQIQLGGLIRLNFAVYTYWVRVNSPIFIFIFIGIRN
jgi:hypothetical protein